MEKHADDVAMLMTDVVMPGMNGRNSPSGCSSSSRR